MIAASLIHNGQLGLSGTARGSRGRSAPGPSWGHGKTHKTQRFSRAFSMGAAGFEPATSRV
jgi:hypothetical protein